MKHYFQLFLSNSAIVFLVSCSSSGGGGTSSDEANVIIVLSITDAPQINAANELDYSANGTCPENDATLNVRIGEVPDFSLTCLNSRWEVENFDTSSIPEGPVVVTIAIPLPGSALGGGSAEQEQEIVRIEIVKDITAPVIGLSSLDTLNPPISLENREDYLLHGECDELDQVIKIIAGNVSATANCDGSTWSASLNLSLLTEDRIQVVIDSQDTVGNPAQASLEILQDIIPPTITLVSSMINSLNMDDYTLSGTCSEPGLPVLVFFAGGSGEQTDCDNNGNWSLAPTLSGVNDDDQLAIRVEHRDTVRNLGFDEANVIKDITLPTLSVTNDANSFVNNANQGAYPLAGTCSEEGQQVTVTGQVDDPASPYTPLCQQGNWSIELGLAGYSEGELEFTISQSDVNQNQRTLSHLIQKDTILPTLQFDGNLPSINSANSTRYRVRGTCVEEGTVSVGLNDGTNPSISLSATCNELGTWATEETDLQNDLGEKVNITVTASMTDIAGNVGTSIETTIYKDTLSRAIAIDLPTPINSANEESYLVSGTCSDHPGQITVLVQGQSPDIHPSCTNGRWSTFVDMSLVADNSRIEILARFGTGEELEEVPETTFKDTVLPVLTVSEPILPINRTNQLAYTLGGTCDEANKQVSVTIGGTIGPLQADCDGSTWSLPNLDLRPLGDAAIISVDIAVDLRDNADNRAILQLVTLERDIVDPVVAITSALTINNNRLNSYQIEGTCSEANGVVSVNVAGLGADREAVCTAGNDWALPLTAEDINSIGDTDALLIGVTHDDSVGNRGSDSISIIKDTMNPTLAVTTDLNIFINVDNQGAYSLMGTCSNEGQIIQFNLGEQNLGSTNCTGLAWEISTLNLTSAGEGSVDVVITHYDANENSIEVTHSLNKDITLPTMDIATPDSISSANHAAYELRGTCSEDDGSILVTVGTVTPVQRTIICQNQVWETGAFSVESVEDDEELSIVAVITDVADNEGVPVQVAVQKNTAPRAVAIDSPGAINIENDHHYTVSGTCSSHGGIVTVSVAGVNPDTRPECLSQVWTTFVNMEDILDSDVIAITARYGDESELAEDSAETVKDTERPVVSFSDSLSNINRLNQSNFLFSGQCSEDGSLVILAIRDMPAVEVMCSTGAWEVTLSVESLTVDTVMLTANLNDAADNSAVSATSTIERDVVDPEIMVTSAPPINILTTGYVLEGTCSEVSGRIRITLGGLNSEETSCADGNTWTLSPSLTGLTDGDAIPLSVEHWDVAGNKGTQTTTMIRDTSAPVLSVTSIETVVNDANEGTFPLGGTCSEEGQEVNVLLGGMATLRTSDCTNLVWSVELNLSAPGDGPVELVIRQEDSNQNIGQIDHILTKDGTIPTVQFASDLPSIDGANKESYQIRGTCSEEGTVTVSVSVTPSSPTLTVTTSCESQVWMTEGLSFATIADGEITFKVSMVDNADNASSQVVTTVQKDTTVRAIAINDPNPINIDNRGTYPVTGNCGQHHQGDELHQ